ncbi:hypothetical protein EYZ11_006885 [Aspergillus tanneri]|uniref:Uncharacterized protein n=1 Tax=Aspergillus tanneri TaxID=1220188 RepID=A0A4S3JEV0_9EURO|nr:uncharacterized protein ATNIH1004_008738 [Aspergillus tanneri]KAA8644534.1 hypothetical protein ATNIH1004_008738 [Aspergillus tanneri]THC93635.1 hypothetical protein EYZ11_006885 [Aspergillus tanneri]
MLLQYATAYQYIATSILIAHSMAQDMLDDVEGQNTAGAEGPSDGSVGVTSTGMIILCTIVGVVAVIGISSAALFVIAKRRQWEMREAIRRSARQITQAVKTPLTPRFPSSQLRQLSSESNLGDSGKQRREAGRRDNDMEKNADVTEHESSGSNKTRTWGKLFSFGRK